MDGGRITDECWGVLKSECSRQLRRLDGEAHNRKGGTKMGEGVVTVRIGAVQWRHRAYDGGKR